MTTSKMTTAFAPKPDPFHSTHHILQSSKIATAVKRSHLLHKMTDSVVYVYITSTSSTSTKVYIWNSSMLTFVQLYCWMCIFLSFCTLFCVYSKSIVCGSSFYFFSRHKWLHHIIKCKAAACAPWHISGIKHEMLEEPSVMCIEVRVLIL